MQDKKKYALCWVSLGCPKNLVDTERTLGRLVERGWLISENPEDADIVVVNTCGFICEATAESIAVLRELAERKKEAGFGLIAAGCLVERMGNALSAEVPEVDALVGLADADEIEEACREILLGRGRLFKRKPQVLHDDRARLRVTPRHYAYLRVTEGCDNCCSYCVIPLIRGKLISKPLEMVIAEAHELVEDGARELIIIGQDTTAYGSDLPGRENLASLLRELCRVPATWIRLLYAHPAHLTAQVVDTVAANDKIVNYFDLPIQHINDSILRNMNRMVTRKRTEQLIDRIRKTVPGAVIRTSVIVGLPGETEEAFEELLQFIEDVRFERLGAFAYSREEGVPACDFPDQVPEEVKNRRLEIIMERQQKIAAEFARSMVGKTVDVVIERKSKQKRRLWEGRTYADAPDVDGIIYLPGKDFEPGTFTKAKVTRAFDYDLQGEVIT